MTTACETGKNAASPRKTDPDEPFYDLHLPISSVILASIRRLKPAACPRAMGAGRADKAARKTRKRKTNQPGKRPTGAKIPRPRVSANWDPTPARWPWNEPRTLRELVQFLGETEQSLLPYFNDYKLNIIDFHTITPEEIAAIPGDFRFYATFLYNMAHRDNKIVFPGVENTTLAKRFVKVFCNADDEIIFPDERLKEGGYEMNELVANYLDYERMQNAKVYVANHCEEWREEGRQEERQATEQKLKGAAQNLYQKNFTSIQIAEMLNVDQAMVEHWLDEI